MSHRGGKGHGESGCPLLCAGKPTLELEQNVRRVHRCHLIFTRISIGLDNRMHAEAYTLVPKWSSRNWKFSCELGLDKLLTPGVGLRAWVGEVPPMCAPRSGSDITPGVDVRQERKITIVCRSWFDTDTGEEGTVLSVKMGDKMRPTYHRSKEYRSPGDLNHEVRSWWASAKQQSRLPFK